MSVRKAPKEQPTPLPHVKIHEGLLRASRKDGSQTSVLFFLSVKRLSVSGVIKDYPEYISRKTGYSRSSVYGHVGNLCHMGLASKGTTKSGVRYIRLVSQTKLFDRLGFEVSTKLAYNESRPKEKERIPVYLLTSEDKGEMISEMQYREIRANLHRQRHKLAVNVTRQKLSSKYGTNPKPVDTGASPSVFRRELKRTLKTLDAERKFAQTLHVLQTDPAVHSTVNYDISLSTRKVARMFGLSSASSGTRIETKLKADGVLGVKQRTLKCMSNVDPSYIQMAGLPKCFFVARGNLYRRLTNKLTDLGL